jgi:hypothetical protein
MSRELLPMFARYETAAGLWAGEWFWCELVTSGVRFASLSCGTSVAPPPDSTCGPTHMRLRFIYLNGSAYWPGATQATRKPMSFMRIDG